MRSGPSRTGKRDLLAMGPASPATGIPWRKMREQMGKSKDKFAALQLIAAVAGYQPLPHQLRGHLSKAPQKLLCAGIGSGKTMWSIMEAISLIILNPGCAGAFFSPTYDSVSHVILPEFTRVMEAMTTAGYPLMKRYHKSMARADLVCGGRVFLRSFERVDNARGWSLAWAAVDEASTANDPKYVWDVISGRIRDNNANIRQIHATTTPRGLRGVIALFVDQRQHGDKSQWWAGKASSYTNPHLPDGYLESLRQGYSKRMWAQEVEAEILRPTNTVFSEIREDHAIPYSYDRAAPYDIAVDWGYAHPCCLWIQRLPDNTAIVFDQFVEDEVPQDSFRRTIVARCKRLGADPVYAVGDRASKQNQWWLINTFPATFVKSMRTKDDQFILNGIETLRHRLDPLDGPPTLYVADNIRKSEKPRSLWQSLRNYRWQVHRDGTLSDRPFKDNVWDHQIDALRYWAVTMSKLEDKTVIQGTKTVDPWHAHRKRRAR